MWSLSGKPSKRASVSEVFSEPRATLAVGKHRLQPGTAFDLATGWNFSSKKDQQDAWKILQAEKPALIILSPPCTARSRIRNLSDFKRDPTVVAAERESTRRHVDFCARLARC